MRATPLTKSSSTVPTAQSHFSHEHLKHPRTRTLQRAGSWLCVGDIGLVAALLSSSSQEHNTEHVDGIGLVAAPAQEGEGAERETQPGMSGIRLNADGIRSGADAIRSEAVRDSERAKKKPQKKKKKKKKKS